MIPRIKEFVSYVKTFYRLMGWRFIFVFILTLFAAVAESLGVVLIIPLLEVLDNSSGSLEISEEYQETFAVLDIFGIDLQQSSVAILISIAVFFLIKALFLYFAEYYKARIKTSLNRKLKIELFDKIFRVNYLYYLSRDSGYFYSLIDGQVNQFVGSSQTLISLISAFVSSSVYLVLALYLSIQFGLGAIVIGFIILFLFRYFNQVVKKLSFQQSNENAVVSKLLIQTFYAYKYLTATNQMESIRNDVVKSIGKLTDIEFKTRVIGAIIGKSREPIAVLAILGIVVIQISYFEQPLEPIIVSILLFHKSLNSVLSFQTFWQGFLAGSGAINFVTNEMRELNKNRAVDGRVCLAGIANDLVLQDVSFSYQNDNSQALSNISLVIEKNSTVAIVGESGSGKSTLVDILSLMIRPTSGKIFVDGIDSVDLSGEAWRRNIGFVSQESVIFDDTIAGNILMQSLDSPYNESVLEQIGLAAEQAALTEYIDSLPNGLFTEVGEKGVKLSGGQKQRLFIARELFRNPGLLILDEATSALDSESESVIQQSIEKLRGSVTIIIISHRLSTVKNCDKIFVLDKGKLIETGTFSELRNTGEKFASFCKLQSI